MFFKGLKEKSIQKAIVKHNNSRELLDGNSKIKTIGFLINTDEVSITESELTSICSVLNSENKGQLNFTKTVKKTNLELGLISPKNIGWSAVLKHPDLKAFCKIEFDVLITLTETGSVYLDAINAFSQAKFKVSTTCNNEELNDLIVTTLPFKVDVFTSELKKYLTILNKL
jgi:hypothetical protein